MNGQEAVTWLRPEFQGREDELVNLAAAAQLVGVSRSTVSNWSKRHRNFPKIALLTGIGVRRNKHVPRDEFLDFARIQLRKKRGPGPAAKTRRPAAQRRADDVAYAERQITRLSDLEQRQAAALARTRRDLKQHQARLERARRLLAAEVAAVRELDQGQGSDGVVPNGDETD
ncbi:hypothetical protein [Streptomyces jumonjinensis]|uniref:Helix-turn-helix domain-containing protein n=1 Tax=Streptomyces jumonjinensis TaxID=1945 RepID=A0A646KT09_STRJU|nr:hypothetical protein [Streptomyces jumonjinensis]MQT05459.1 hypothetical protein [Streptomyces jumonjinensis]